MAVNVIKNLTLSKISGKKVKSLTPIEDLWELQFQDGMKLYFRGQIFNEDKELVNVKS